MSDDGKKKDAGRFSVLFFVVLIVAGYFAWQHYKKTPETAEEAVERTVSAAPLIEREAEVEKNYIGYVMPVHDVSVRPYISGFVDEIRVKGGSEVKAGDVIDVVEGSRKIEKFAKLTGADAAVVALPSWLSRETGSLKGVVTKLPERSDIDFDVQEHLIVELYSK